MVVNSMRELPNSIVNLAITFVSQALPSTRILSDEVRQRVSIIIGKENPHLCSMDPIIEAHAKVKQDIRELRRLTATSDLGEGVQ